MQLISIAYEYKGRPRKKHIRAEVVGSLAFHPTVRERGFWTVTHLATGRAVYRFLLSAGTAKSVAHELSRLEWPRSEKDVVASAALKAATTHALNAVGIRP